MKQTPNAIPLTKRFDEALIWARETHVEPRKGTTIPYVSHLMAVAGLVLEMGGDEDAAIAGLLHDIVEDTDGPDGVTVADVRARFGEQVAGLVEAASEDPDMPRGPSTWRERKELYLAKIDAKTGDELRVSLADKIANVRSILIGASEGPQFWERFNGGEGFPSKAAAQAWSYAGLASRFDANRERMDERAQPFVDEFLVLVERLEGLAAR
jgi:(p)ppGpp synthase/HD superfamily hydrolase